MIFVNMDDDILNKSMGFHAFDIQMSNIDITLENFTKLLDGILKKHGTDDLEYQRKIERIAWDQIKHKYEPGINFTHQALFQECFEFTLKALFRKQCTLQT